MINTKQFELSQMANTAMKQALAKRIPNLYEHRVDNNPNAVSQIDFFGNVDSIMQFGSTRTWLNQYKSRRKGAEEICFECRSYRGRFINPETKQPVPISGAYYYEPDKCWMVPRLGEIDCMTVCLPVNNDDNDYVIMHFARYYLDILFSQNAIWQHASKVRRMYDDTDTYLIYFDYRIFVNLYMDCVGKVTYGDKYNVIKLGKEENNNVLEQNNYETNNDKSKVKNNN